MSVAFVDLRPPELLNGHTAFLIAVLGTLAYVMSPLCGGSRTLKDRAAFWGVVGIFLWWFMFQYLLISLRPGIHYYLSPHGVYAWTLNSGICFAFGLGFALHLIRSARKRDRLFGICGAFAYGALVLLLLLWPTVVRPGLQRT